MEDVMMWILIGLIGGLALVAQVLGGKGPTGSGEAKESEKQFEAEVKEMVEKIEELKPNEVKQKFKEKFGKR